MVNERWRHPHQEKIVQRGQVEKIKRLPILEQAEMLERDAEILVDVIEFGHQVRELLNRFGSANTIPETNLEEVVEGFDYPPGMALALARVFERQTEEKAD